MQIRSILAALALTSVLAGCQTLSGADKPQVDKQFANEDDFRQWFAFYYKEPHPEYITSALKYMRTQHYLEEFPDIASVFLSRVFATNPDALTDWAASWDNLGQEEWNVICVALWLTNTPTSKDLLAKNLERAAPDRREHLRDMLKSDPGDIDPMTAEVVDPRQINLIWAAFSATGDERYVKRVISYVHFYGEESDERQAAIGEAAIMTLANNTLQHQVVARICAEEHTVNPDPRTRVLLKAMLNALAQLQKDNQLPPAH
jgi:hypothetical protein